MLLFYVLQIKIQRRVTERRGQVVNTPPLRFCEVPVFNFDPEIGYPDSGFSLFFSVPPGKCRDSSRQ
jgi:hypothetical protein